MSDTYKNIDCPACGKSMTKIYLSEQGFFVDSCLKGCGGLWFDNREASKVDEKDEPLTEIIDAYKDKTFESVDKFEQRFCPVCKQKMVKNNVSAKREISIDECYSCGGKFFDYKELEEMRNQYENDEERLEDVKALCQNSEEMINIFNRILNKDNFTDEEIF